MPMYAADELCTAGNIDTRGLTPRGFLKHLEDDHYLDHAVEKGRKVYLAAEAKAAAQDCMRLCEYPGRTAASATPGVHQVDETLLAPAAETPEQAIARLKKTKGLLTSADIGKEFIPLLEKPIAAATLVIKLKRYGLVVTDKVEKCYLYRRRDVEVAFAELKNADATRRGWRLTPNR